MAESAFEIEVFDQVPGRERRSAGALHLASERITAAELLRRRVEAEVARHNGEQSQVYEGLVQPTDAEAALNGVRLKKRRTLDAAVQTTVALEAFDQGKILMLFDDRQVDGPDELLSLTGENQVTFIRLVPLVGG
ncbi:MAG: hypothetical protein AAF495_02920 [Pseudomonadota bacterium]